MLLHWCLLGLVGLVAGAELRRAPSEATPSPSGGWFWHLATLLLSGSLLLSTCSKRSATEETLTRRSRSRKSLVAKEKKKTQKTSIRSETGEGKSGRDSLINTTESGGDEKAGTGGNTTRTGSTKGSNPDSQRHKDKGSNPDSNRHKDTGSHRDSNRHKDKGSHRDSKRHKDKPPPDFKEHLPSASKEQLRVAASKEQLPTASKEQLQAASKEQLPPTPAEDKTEEEKPKKQAKDVYTVVVIPKDKTDGSDVSPVLKVPDYKEEPQSTHSE